MPLPAIHESIRRPLLITVAALLAIGGLFWWLQRRNAVNPNATTLKASGTIEANEVQVGAPRGARLLEYRVREGEKVTQGQVIAVLENRDVQNQLQQAQSGARAAEARLQEVRRGPREEEVQAAGAQVDQARAGLEGAQRALNTAQEAYRSRPALRQARDAARAQRETAEAQLAAAETGLTTAEEMVRLAEREQGPSVQLRQNLVVAEQQARNSESALRAASAQRTRVEESAPQAVRAAQALVDQAGSAVDLARQDLQHSTEDLQVLRFLVSQRAIPARRQAEAEARAQAARERLEQAEAALRQADAGLRQANAGAPAERTAAQAQVEQAESAVDAGRRALALAREAANLNLMADVERQKVTGQREQARAALRSARAALDGARRSAENAERAYNQALAERQDVSTARQAVETARAQLEAAEAQLTLRRKGPPRDVVAQAEAQVDQARTALNQARILVEQSNITSPINGVVSEQTARPGELVAPGAVIATVVNLDEVFLTLYVPASQAARLQTGMDAEVSAPALPAPVQGDVTFISSEPEFTPRTVQTPEERERLVQQVRVTLPNPRGVLKPGMPADATIHLRQASAR